MRSIKLEERRKYMLDICQAVDDCCRKNGIEYSIAYGTLLGAKRHGGFIPWDDDFDILMTKDNYDKFNKCFSHNRYKSLNCFSNKKIHYSFGIVVDTDTYSLASKNIFGKRHKEKGISIDIYIVYNVPSSKEFQNQLFKKFKRLSFTRKYAFKIMAILRRLGLSFVYEKIFPYCNYTSKMKISFLNNTKTTGKVICIAGGGSDYKVLDLSLFSEYTDYKFEDRIFRGIKNFEDFLTVSYGDWRQLPPEKDRHPYHGGDFYTDK